jgi:hypothetical protein
MKFRQFALCCECGLIPTRIRQVGLSIEHQLVIHWWCIGCRKAMFFVKDLAECWEESPKPDEIGIASSPAYDLERQRGDVNFLHSMGIRFPGEDADGA